MDLLFPFAEYWWFYGAFTVFVLGMVAADLGLFHRKAHAVGVREAATWTGVTVVLSLVFAGILYGYSHQKFGAETAGVVVLEYLTGWIIEYALAVDNIFVFAMVFGALSIPAAYQHRVLVWGILGALVFRGLFIALGAALMQFHWVVVAAGLFLIATGAKMFFGSGEDNPAENRILKFLRRYLRITPELHGEAFAVRRNGLWYATPLLLALLFIEISDVIFALDSVPAIFAVTREPLLVFTSNVFAILGLRSMYFLLANVLHRFHLLKYGLATVLVFVGLKMVWLNDAFGGKFPISLSLGIIAGVLVLSVVASLLVPPRARPADDKPANPAERTAPAK